MKTPRLSAAVLDGVIAATSLYLAGPPDCGCDSGEEFDEQERAYRAVEAADKWAKAKRDERSERAERRHAGLSVSR